MAELDTEQKCWELIAHKMVMARFWEVFGPMRYKRWDKHPPARLLRFRRRRRDGC